MNLVGKIFTVLIFLMCIVFGTFALMTHAAHKNWWTVVKDLDTQLKAAIKDKEELTKQKQDLTNALENEKVSTRKRLVALENEVTIVKNERDDKDKKLQIEEGKSRVLALAIQEVHKRLEVLQTTITGLQTNIKVVVDERNATQTKLVNTTDQLMIALNESGRLAKLAKELGTQVMKLKETMAFNKVPNNTLKDAPADLEGEVTAVPRPDTVEISVGGDDGVRKGHKFTVTRRSAGEKYIGVIEVIQVDYPNRCVCRPDKTLMSDVIQKGDHVKAKPKDR